MRRILIVITTVVAMNSCNTTSSVMRHGVSPKYSLHGQANDYEYEAKWDERHESECNNCDEID